MLSRPHTYLFAFLAGGSLLVSASMALADSPSIDPRIDRVLDTGLIGPHALGGLRTRSATAPVIIELKAPATAASLAQLRAKGVQVAEVDGRPLYYRQFVSASIRRSSLQALASLPQVARVSLAPASGLHPLDHSAQLTGLEAARGARPALDRLTGKGVVIADLDSNVDVFHPHFFRGDGGYYDWIDTNHDGKLTPKVDAIDLNRDGQADESEIAQPLIAQMLQIFYGSPTGAREEDFDPSLDWLYLDTNKNGERDFGKAAGFNEQTPAYGEPLFVPDDVNRNGRLDVGERIVRLGTSKFRKVFVNVQYYNNINHVFERGVDLIDHENDYTHGAYGYGDSLHGTGVLSTIAADVPLVGRRLVGLAPDADLLLAFEVTQTQGNSMTWALGEHPDVMLHETANWTGEPLDGSDTYSKMVDESAVQDNITHSCPMGNTGGAQKHAHLAIAHGQSVTLTFDNQAHSSDAYYIDMSLNIRGAQGLVVKLTEPSGANHSLSSGSGGTLAGGATYYVTRSNTARQTQFIDTILYSDPNASTPHPIPVGQWTVEITNNKETDATVDGYLSDDKSGWNIGAAWAQEIATDQSTAGIPAVSDHCIAVGAHTGHPRTSAEPWFSGEETQTEVRDYSGRGPRIDGVLKPDVLAPDNPWVAAAHEKGYSGDMIPYGALWPFGGTSGAGPHVTGVTALLAQAGIRGDAARDAIRQGAVADSTTGAVPNMVYGYGRLNAANSLGVSPEGQPPTVELKIEPSIITPGQSATARLTVADPDGDGTKLQVRWDDGYDGSWDGEFQAPAERTLQPSSLGKYPYKVQVRDAQGRIAEAVGWLTVSDTLPEAGPDAEQASDGSVEGGNPQDAGADGATAPGEGSSDDDGCGCRTAGHSTRAWPALMLGAALAWLASRRRPSRTR